MTEIKEEIDELKQKNSESAAKNLKIAHRKRIEEALRFFKEETIRLSKLYKKNEAELEKLKKTAESYEFDKKFLEAQLENKKCRAEKLRAAVTKTTSLFQRLIHSENKTAQEPVCKNK